MGVQEKASVMRDKIFSCSSASMKEQLGYSGGIFGNAMGQDSVHTYGDQFSRDFAKIGDKLMLVKANAATILSFLIPPIAGAWYDSPQKGKVSHLRQALRIMPIPFAISSMLLFIVPSSNVLYNFIWTFAFGVIFDVVDTFYDIAMATLGLKLCTDPKDRTGFFTLSSWASTLGSMLPGWIIPIIVGSTDDLNSQKWRYFYVALVFCVLGVASMYLPYFTINERVDASIDELARKKQANETEHIQWNRETLRAILHNRPFMIIQISLFCDTIRQVTYTALPYLYRNVFGDYKMKAIIDMISGGLSYIGLAAVPFVGNKVSARNMMVGGYGYTAFFYALMSVFNFNIGGKGKMVAFDRGHVDALRKYRYLIGAVVGLAGMPNAAQGAARKIITADSTDYMEWYGYKEFGTQVRSDGMLSAAGNIVTKINSLAKANLYNGLFVKIDYEYINKRTEEVAAQYRLKDPKISVIEGKLDANDKYWTVLGRLFLVITLCGLIGNTLSAVSFLFDNYTGKRKQMILDELNVSRKKHELVMAQMDDDGE
ncbi:MAG TPA: hypothetical protein DDY98_01825 [Ruminococcaceae bacterium]|nr:hypothetical protein [Oscillospiraceae bacterium]